MKKIVSYLLCVALLVSCLALTACGGKKKSESADLTGSKIRRGHSYSSGRRNRTYGQRGRSQPFYLGGG